MITFKLINHNLYDKQWVYSYKTEEYEHNPLLLGTKVCTLKSLANVGVVTRISEAVTKEKPSKYEKSKQERVYYKEVTVLWVTGAKRGMTEVKKTENLTNFASYKSAVAEHLKKITDYEAEANAFGM